MVVEELTAALEEAAATAPSFTDSPRHQEPPQRIRSRLVAAAMAAVVVTAARAAQELAARRLVGFAKRASSTPSVK